MLKADLNAVRYELWRNTGIVPDLNNGLNFGSLVRESKGKLYVYNEVLKPTILSEAITSYVTADDLAKIWNTSTPNTDAIAELQSKLNKDHNPSSLLVSDPAAETTWVSPYAEIVRGGNTGNTANGHALPSVDDKGMDIAVVCKSDSQIGCLARNTLQIKWNIDNSTQAQTLEEMWKSVKSDPDRLNGIYYIVDTVILALKSEIRYGNQNTYSIAPNTSPSVQEQLKQHLGKSFNQFSLYKTGLIRGYAVIGYQLKRVGSRVPWGFAHGPQTDWVARRT